MRRAALRVACAVSLVTAVVAVIARSSAIPATKTPASITTSLVQVTPGNEQRVPASIPTWTLGLQVHYMGRLTSTTTENYNGSYRAECVWLGEESVEEQTEIRLNCTVWLRLKTGTLVADGQVTRPTGSSPLLPAGASAPPLAITGGTAQFEAAGGWIGVDASPLTAHVTQAWATQ
jgi:hypothetical protein